jgi:predicted protein tyrosine phosphatase
MIRNDVWYIIAGGGAMTCSRDRWLARYKNTMGNKVVLCLDLMTDLYKSISLVLEIVLLQRSAYGASLPVIVAP